MDGASDVAVDLSADAAAIDLARLSAAHLHVRLKVLNRSCQRALQLRHGAAAVEPTASLSTLLADIEQAARLPLDPDPSCGLGPDDHAADAVLRSAAQSAGVELPLDRLTARYGLSEFDQLALVAVAAAEFHPAYGRLYAELFGGSERTPTVACLLALTDGVDDHHRRRLALGPHGTLRRYGLVVAESDRLVDIGARLTLSPGVFDVLLGARIDVGLLGADAGEVPHVPVAVRALEWQQLAPIVAGLGTGDIDLIGLWGLRESLVEPWITMLTTAAGSYVRRAPTETWSESLFPTCFREAGFLEAVLWIPLDRLDEDTSSTALDELARTLVATEQPVVITAAEPWRHPQAIAARRFIEHSLPELSSVDRAAAWHVATDGRLEPNEAARLGARWRLEPAQVRAATTIAAVEGTLTGTTPGPDELDRAAATVTASSSGRLVTVVSPRRGPDELVLPPDAYEQVLELGHFARLLPEICERWGFGRLMTGAAGLKALFVGEPGTGKTLAAEVIAGLVSTQLLRVDLSRVVSKWVGETSKHVEQIFREAGDGHGVLFFDEADALFGKRGEVQHGTDRYANTEVSHLLQRFEQYQGLVILATNLRENIDPAFLRRFDTVTYFPRPMEAERRRLWRLSFPPEAPLDDCVDLDFLATLDFTGAGIAAAARMAGLLASVEEAARIDMSHVLAGVRRQFRTEGRILSLDELAPYTAGPAGAI